ncbi:iron-sulfur cluster biosynthesis family protein [Lacticaseibacillus thailandensis]
MDMRFDEATSKFIQSRLGDNHLLLTFEDGVGPYSQHAMMHMQTQFTVNIVPPDADLSDYDTTVDSNLGPVLVKGYSTDYLDPHLSLHSNSSDGSWSLHGDVGVLDDDVHFIDFVTNERK